LPFIDDFQLRKIEDCKLLLTLMRWFGTPKPDKPMGHKKAPLNSEAW